MSTSFAATLEDDDLIERIFTLAGELEVSEPNSNHEEWAHLIALIRRLSDDSNQAIEQ